MEQTCGLHNLGEDTFIESFKNKFIFLFYLPTRNYLQEVVLRSRDVYIELMSSLFCQGFAKCLPKWRTQFSSLELTVQLFGFEGLNVLIHREKCFAKNKEWQVTIFKLQEVLTYRLAWWIKPLTGLSIKHLWSSSKQMSSSPSKRSSLALYGSVQLSFTFCSERVSSVTFSLSTVSYILCLCSTAWKLLRRWFVFHGILPSKKVWFPTDTLVTDIRASARSSSGVHRERSLGSIVVLEEGRRSCSWAPRFSILNCQCTISSSNEVEVAL